jgi:outer membrane immunogenic protein
VKTIVIGISVIVALIGTPALAADMAVKAPPPASVAPAYGWTGFYVGGNAGYAWGTTTAIDDPNPTGGCWASCGATFNTTTNGFTGGGQAGYNWQSGSVVYGLEADLGDLSVRGTGPYQLSPGTFVRTNGDLFTTVRARLGVTTLNNWLLFATGGYFGADFNSTIFTSPTAAGNHIFNMPNTGFQSGWTVGGGAEYALMNRWSIKAEYLYYEAPQKSVSTFPTLGLPPFNLTIFGIKNTGNLVRIGLNYHLN